MKSKTGSEQGTRMIYESGCVDLPRQKAKVQASMFQFIKSKKKGRKK
ncbi:MAG: hypothetical protein KHZ58_12340 [Hungatella hathewayi]|nr:hypothetical protein [Hungatella hathewayi]